MRIAIALIALAVTGCGQQDTGPSLADIHAECRVGGRPFVETWGCERVGISDMYGYADIKGVYIATGDFVVTQVQDGQMTDAEAKLTMAQARQQAATDSGNRHRQDQAAVNARRAAITSAMSGMRVYQPTNAAIPQPTIIGTPSGGIICQRTGPTSVMCN